MNIPKQISGRNVTNRGWHLQPFAYHARFMERKEYWIGLLKAMGCSWVVIITDGDSILEDFDGITIYETLLQAGIIPLVREAITYPRYFTNWDTIERCAAISEQYGTHPFWLCRNEPGDGREHVGGKAPPYPELWSMISEFWAEDARIVTQSGGIAGFPDGPSYPDNPFERLTEHDGLRFFNQGVAFYAGHHYGKGRPLDYPYDDVTRHGTQLTEEGYRAALDDFADDPGWYDLPLGAINDQRAAWANPNLTTLEDDTCFRGWEKIVHWSNQTLGYTVPMALTEGGYCPRDRAGSNPVDVRWPYTTPNMVAQKTVAMFGADSPFFAMCPWLLADSDLGGAGSWEFDAAVGWAYDGIYEREKPVVQALMAQEEADPVEDAVALLGSAADKLFGALTLT